MKRQITQMREVADTNILFAVGIIMDLFFSLTPKCCFIDFPRYI